MPDTRVIFDVLLLVKFITFLIISNFLFITPNSDLFLIADHLATDCGKFWWGSLLKSDMRSGNIARSCGGRLSISNLHGHTPCVLDWVSSRARQDQLFKIIAVVIVVTHFQSNPVGDIPYIYTTLLWIGTTVGLWAKRPSTWVLKYCFQ